MPTFQSKPLHRRSTSPFSRFVPHVRHRPVLFFGLPFVLTIVAASFGLSRLTQTRYDYNASKVQTMSKEEELNMKQNRKKIDIREEYYRLQGKADELDDWEPKRIERPEGVPEWGIPSTTLSDKPPQPRDYSRIRSVLEASESASSSIEGKEKGEEKEGKSLGKGVILGPDGKPCRACNSKLAFSRAMKTSPLPSVGAKKAKSAPEEPKEALECPPDGPELGRATWTFLHSAAAYYPDQPTGEQQAAMTSLMQALGHLYPCASCAEGLREEYARERREGGWEAKDLTLESAVKDRELLQRWLCGVHNEVNQRLGKPAWSCNEKKLDERWRDGPADGKCD